MHLLLPRVLMIFAVTVLCIPAWVCGAEPAPFQADPHTVLLLHLDGDAADASGIENHGKVTGTVDWQAGKFGKSLAVAGSGGAIVVWPSGSLCPVDGSWTIEAWIKPDPNNKQPLHSLFLSTGFGNSIGYGFEITNNKSIAVKFASGSVANYAESSSVIDQLLDGEWHHVAAVRDMHANGALRVYLDGEEVTAEPVEYPDAVTTTDQTMGLTIGATAPWTYRQEGKNYFGLIDEVRVSDVVRYGDNALAPGEPYVAETSGSSAGTDVPLPPFEAKTHNPLTLNPASTRIVTPQPAATAEREAANLLQTYLRQVVGSTDGFEIVSESSSDASVRSAKAVFIVLGNTSLTETPRAQSLRKYGFLIKQEDNLIAISGKNTHGTYSGAVHFLDRYAGVRFYMPGDLFTAVPSQPKLQVTIQDEIVEPFAHSSYMSGFYSVPKEEHLWAKRNSAVRRDWGSHQHSMYQRFPPARYAERYPKIYPIINGKQYIPQTPGDQRWQPNFAEPTLVDAALDSAVLWFRKNPQRDYISYSIQDSHVFSQDPATLAAQKKYGENEGLVILHYQFLNELAKRLPAALAEAGLSTDKTIVTIAYSKVRTPPPFDLEPNIMPVLVFKTPDLAIDTTLQSGGMGDEWAKRVKVLGHHDWSHGKGFFIPRLHMQLTADFYRYLQERDIEFGYAHIEAYPNWGLSGPNQWVLAQLLWDPQRDVDQMVQQFCQDLFPKSNAEMLGYFQDMEKMWTAMSMVAERKIARWHNQFVLDSASASLLQSGRKHLDAAMKLAGSEEERQRVELFDKSLKLSEMFFAIAAKKSATPRETQQVLTYIREVIVPDPLTIHRPAHAGNGEDYLIKGAESAIKQIAK